jgi:Flp pilus assembly pilin Flp
MKHLLQQLISEEDGQDLVEYALLVGGIGLVIITGVNDIGTAVDGAYNRIEGDVGAIAP